MPDRCAWTVEPRRIVIASMPGVLLVNVAPWTKVALKPTEPEIAGGDTQGR